MRIVPTTRLVTLMSGLIATTAMAQDAGKSRAEVRAELKAAMAAGEIQYGEAASTPKIPTGSASNVTRAQVMAEAIEARRLGLIKSGEAASTPEYSTLQPSNLTRTQVRAEAVEAARLGLFSPGEAPAHVPSEAELAQVRLAGERAM